MSALTDIDVSIFTLSACSEPLPHLFFPTTIPPPYQPLHSKLKYPMPFSLARIRRKSKLLRLNVKP